MAYSFIRFVREYDDPVWGRQALPWIKSPLIRVYRNRLRKAAFEYVGHPKAAVDVAQWKRINPIVMYEERASWDNGFGVYLKPKLP